MYDASLSSSVYFELDITGNVRRLRGGKALSTSAPLASDLGGYRYTAFGQLNTTDTTTAYPSVAGQRYDQPLRWQSRWFIDSGSGLYDFRARVWSPELAAFLQPDEYGFLTRSGTLWSWPGQNPFRYADPTGRDAIGRWIGSAVGEILGGGIGGALGAVAGGAATVETGPGAIAGAGVGAFEGGTLGADVGALAGGALGDAVGDALNGIWHAKPGENRCNKTGSYTNTHESGKTYSGKGDQDRSQQSGQRVADENDDPHTSTDWTPSDSDRDAFKDESRRLDDQGGPADPNNYNKIESPGKKYRNQDGE